MSWHFLQGGAEAYWLESSLDGAPSVLLKLMPEQDQSFSIDNGIEQLMRLYHRMTTPRCQEILMFWPEGWTDSKPLEMDGFRQWLQEHSLVYAGHLSEDS